MGGLAVRVEFKCFVSVPFSIVSVLFSIVSGAVLNSFRRHVRLFTVRFGFVLMDCQYGCILSRSSRGSFGGRSGVVLRIVSGAEKKAFDRGGLVWPPRSNAKDGRSGRALPPQPKTRGSGGQRPLAKNFEKSYENNSKKFGNKSIWCGYYI